jgi:menaquinone-specific isochorismate synthase
MTLAVHPQTATVTPIAFSCDSALQTCNKGRTTFLSSLTPLRHAVDPLAFLAAGAKHVNRTALFWQPFQGKVLVGLGAAHAYEAAGPGRFRSLGEALNDFGDSLIRSDQGKFPILAGGAFHDHIDSKSAWRDFPAATFAVPSVLLQIDENGVALRVTTAIDDETTSIAADDEMRSLHARAVEWSNTQLSISRAPALTNRSGDEDRVAWNEAVTRVVQEIRRHEFQKVVLARQQRLEASGPFSPIEVLDRLRVGNPNATLFSISHGNAWFLGASPERLVRLSDGRVDVSCLAGSISLGNSVAERQKLAEELLHSQKDRLEHELVVRPIMCLLGDVCADVARLPGTPRVIAARSVQHLETAITARLRGAGNVLDLVELLHPTPAVGGFPRLEALQAMRKFETIERGWYAGPFGWTDLEGNGEFIVALRSALLSGSRGTVFAGCGIVADSIPACEYEESQLKMRPMLTALGAE